MAVPGFCASSLRSSHRYFARRPRFALLRVATGQLTHGCAQPYFGVRFAEKLRQIKVVV